MLESIAKGEGKTVNVGEVIGTIGEGDGRPAAQPEAEEEGTEEAEAEQPEAEAETAEKETDGHREAEEGGFRASSSVRKLAQEYEIDFAEVSGSGSGGRITREDVERLIRERDRGGAPAREAETPAPERDGKRAERPAPAAEMGGRSLKSASGCHAAGSPSPSGSSSRSRRWRCSPPSTRWT